MNKESTANKTSKKRNKVAIIISAILAAAQLGASAWFSYTLIKLNILQPWQNGVIIAILALLEFLTVYKLIISKKTRLAPRIILSILSVIISAAAVVGAQYIGQATSFIETITGDHYEDMAYKVLALKDSKISDVKQLDSKKVAFLTTDPNCEKAKSTLKDTVKYVAEDSTDLATMIASVTENKVEAIVLADSYIDTLEENKNEFATNHKVIYEFTVRVEAKAEANRVDVVKQPFALYISGSDSRNGISKTARSDVNIVAVVRPAEGKILLVSIPRDYYVQLHGTTGTKDKLTHAGIYGINMSKTTIEDLLGISINYTLKVSFDTVIKIVDKVDGIDIDSDTKFTAWTNRSCKFAVGVQHVGSDCALAFARERYAYAAGDRHRGENQQQVITKLIDKITSPHYITRWMDIMKAAEGSFETSLSYDEITDFARFQLSELKSWKVESISLDGTGASMPTYSMGSQNLYVMIPNQETVDAAKAKIAEYLK